MKRGYTVGEYREMLARIGRNAAWGRRDQRFHRGFCGETEEDYRQTAELVRDARFKNSFIFKYSARPETKAAELFSDDVPEPVKRRRNNELLAIQNAISEEDNQPFVGPHRRDPRRRAQQDGPQAGRQRFHAATHRPHDLPTGSWFSTDPLT